MIILKELTQTRHCHSFWLRFASLNKTKQKPMNKLTKREYYDSEKKANGGVVR